MTHAFVSVGEKHRSQVGKQKAKIILITVDISGSTPLACLELVFPSKLTMYVLELPGL